MTNTADTSRVTPDTPETLDTLEKQVAAFGVKSVRSLLAFQAMHAARAPELRKKVAEIKADPDHPQRGALWNYEMQLKGAEQARRDPHRWRLPSPAVSRPPGVLRPRARGGRPTRARALARSSSRSGDSGDDGPGEPPGDLAAPCCCEQCGNELLLPARLCGLCEEEAGLRPRARACAICGTDISDRRGDAETCGAAHKKTLQRRRAQPVRLVPQSLDHDGSNPLAGVPSDILACVYQNGTSSPPRHVVPRPWRGDRGEIIRIDGPSAHTPAAEPPAPVVDLLGLRLARRHARFVNALAAAASRRMVDRIGVAA
jgi:hypothetical protein